MFKDLQNLSELKSRVHDFNVSRNWQEYHTPKNLACAISAEAGELLELFQWLTPEQSQSLENDSRQAVAAEMADILIFTLSLADTLQIDIAEAIINKLEKNAIKYPMDKTFDPFGKALEGISRFEN